MLSKLLLCFQCLEDWIFSPTQQKFINQSEAASQGKKEQVMT